MAEQELGVDPGDGIDGIGTTLEGADAGPIGMITRLGFEGFNVGEIDITTLNDSDGWRRFIKTLKDARGLTLDLNYQPNNTKVLLDSANATDSDTWTITFPDGATLVVDGFINNMGIAVPMGDKISQTVSIRTSGPPVFYLPS